MSRIHTIALTAITLASLHGAASAADIHVGASVGRSDYRIDTTGATSADTKDTASKVFVDAAITPNLGVEATLFDLGRTSGTVVVAGVGTVNASARVRGIGVSGVLSAPVGPVSLFVKAGIANVRARAETSVNTGLPGSESSWQPTLGFGVSYPIASQVAVRGEWERVRTRFPGGEKDNVDMLSVGVSYRF
ncbi:MAG: porin family protein [Rubrivivax sp.]|nr:porin family protein [Rubrivivax sp.]